MILCRLPTAYQPELPTGLPTAFQPPTNGYQPSICRLPTGLSQPELPTALPTAYQRVPTKHLQALQRVAPNPITNVIGSGALEAPATLSSDAGQLASPVAPCRAASGLAVVCCPQGGALQRWPRGALHGGARPFRPVRAGSPPTPFRYLSSHPPPTAGGKRPRPLQSDTLCGVSKARQRHPPHPHNEVDL